MKATLSSPLTENAVTCPVASFGVLRASYEHLATLRRTPGSYAGKTISPAYLKNADEQTVAGVAALLDTIGQQGWEQRTFHDWGVVAAPNFFGRIGTVHALKRFLAEGAWGISPHLIPHHSLHAMSGTISHALQIQGPNFGIGGGPTATAEAFLVAATMLAENVLPGLWVVLTGFSPEFIPEQPSGKPTQSTECLVAVMALIPGQAAPGNPIFRVGSDRKEVNDPMWPEFCLCSFVEHLDPRGDKGDGCWRLPGSGWIELDWDCETETPR